jgi:hypothetical protein
VSKYQKVSKADMRSCLITGHATWRKCAVKLSGPGDLSDGRDLITDHTSSSEKHELMPAKSEQGRSRLSS